MKKMIWALCLGLSCSISLAAEIQYEDNADESTLNKALEPLETSPINYTELVKSTMDLMGPATEVPQITEEDSTN